MPLGATATHPKHCAPFPGCLRSLLSYFHRYPFNQPPSALDISGGLTSPKPNAEVKAKLLPSSGSQTLVTSEPPGGLVKPDCWTTLSELLICRTGIGPKNLHVRKLPGDADTADPGAPRGEPLI